MKQQKSLVGSIIRTVIFAVVFLVYIGIFLPGWKAEYKELSEIWDTGIETTGVLRGDGKSDWTDFKRSWKQAKYTLEYEVDGTEYETECVVNKSDFKKLNGKQKSGEAEVVLCYDPADPSRATVEQSVKSVKTQKTMGTVCFWGLIVMAGLELLLLPVAIKIDRANR